MRIAIANDHGGYELKQKIIPYLREHENVEIIDYGCYSNDIVRYPIYAEKVCNAILSNKVDRGILICSTGIGMSIVANKYKGIRAALCDTPYQGMMTSKHNNSNVLCLGGRCIGDFMAFEIIHNWLNYQYEGGRHDISLNILKNLEIHNFN